MQILKRVTSFLSRLFKGIFSKTASVITRIVQRIRKVRMFYKVAAIYLLVLGLMVGAFIWRAGTYYPEIPLGKEESPDDSYLDSNFDYDNEQHEQEDSGPVYKDQMSSDPEQDSTDVNGSKESEFAAGEEVVTELLWPFEGGEADGRDRIEVNYGEYVRHETQTGTTALLHTGIAIGLPEGTRVLAAGNGEVIEVKDTDLFYGKSVLLKHSEDVYTFYGSLSEISAEPGQELTVGQTIGKAGETAVMNSGPDQPYLHFELRINDKTVDPLKYLP